MKLSIIIEGPCDDEECRCYHARLVDDRRHYVRGALGWESEVWPHEDDVDAFVDLRLAVDAKADELRAAGHEVSLPVWSDVVCFDDFEARVRAKTVR